MDILGFVLFAAIAYNIYKYVVKKRTPREPGPTVPPSIPDERDPNSAGDVRKREN